jgi:hypothetical protein
MTERRLTARRRRRISGWCDAVQAALRGPACCGLECAEFGLVPSSFYGSLVWRRVTSRHQIEARQAAGRPQKTRRTGNVTSLLHLCR